MTATVSDFRAAFPAFKDSLKYTDGQVQFYLDLGYKIHSADRWGNLLDYGVMLWTAHSMMLDNMQRIGIVTSMSADGVSWSRDIASAVDPRAGHWNLTMYGMRWRDLVNLVGQGPLYVGAPNLYDAWLAGNAWAWPGPEVTW